MVVDASKCVRLSPTENTPRSSSGGHGPFGSRVSVLRLRPVPNPGRAWPKVGPGEHQHVDRQVAGPVNETVKEVQQPSVGVLGVLDQQHHPQSAQNRSPPPGRAAPRTHRHQTFIPPGHVIVFGLRRHDEYASAVRIEPLPEHLYDAAIRLWQDSGLTRPWNDPEADLRRAAGGGSSCVLAAIGDDDSLLATAMVGHDGHRGWVYYLAVDAAQRGRGLGRQMMEACED